MTGNWREEMGLRRVLLPTGLFFGMVLVLGFAMMLLLPLEQRREYWWVVLVLPVFLLGCLWGRAGDRWSVPVIPAVIACMVASERVKPFLFSFLAAAAVLAILYIGYGLGRLSVRRGRSEIDA